MQAGSFFIDVKKKDISLTVIPAIFVSVVAY